MKAVILLMILWVSIGAIDYCLCINSGNISRKEEKQNNKTNTINIGTTKLFKKFKI
jgi:hypothetical protein